MTLKLKPRSVIVEDKKDLKALHEVITELEGKRPLNSKERKTLQRALFERKLLAKKISMAARKEISHPHKVYYREVIKLEDANLNLR